MKPSETSNMYERLGIDENANDEEIKSAYKKAALQWHPDLNENKEISHIEFIAVSEAFERLYQKEKRSYEFYREYKPKNYEDYNIWFKKFFGEDSEFEELFKKRPELKTLVTIYKILKDLK